MSEQECKECQIAAIALKGVSLLGLVLFITIPTTFIMVQNHALVAFEKGVLFFFLLTGLFSGIRFWHLYFDSRLLKHLGDKKMALSDVDQIVLRLFYKSIQDKTVEDRIKSCYKLAKGFFMLLGLHLVCYGIMILLLLF
jgi:hypothetical protein